MAYIILPSRWTQQPGPESQLALGGPFSAGLNVVVYNRIARHGSGAVSRLVLGGTPTFRAIPEGFGPSFAGGANRYTTSVPHGTMASDVPFTIEVLCRVTASPSLAGYFGIAGTGSATARALISFQGASNRNIHFWAADVDVNSGVEWRIDGSIQHVFCVYNGLENTADSLKFYRDGREIFSGLMPAIYDATNDATSGYTVGDMSQGWDSTPTGVIARAAFYRRAMSASEIAERTRYPWLDFQPIQRRTYFKTIGGFSPPPPNIIGWIKA